MIYNSGLEFSWAAFFVYRRF